MNTFNFKQLLFILSIFIYTINGNAQDYTHSLNGIKTIKVGSTTGMIFKTHSQNELLIKDVKARKNPEKANGLKAIYATGDDNTGYGISIEKEGDALIIRNLKDIYSPDLEIHLPKNINLLIQNHGLGDVTIHGFSSEIEVKTNTGLIKITDVTGPIVAKTSTGDVNVIFNTVNQSSPISLLSSAGDVDVTLPKNTPANLNLKAAVGSVFTDFDIQQEKSKSSLKTLNPNRSIKTKINNGGVDISLRSSTGNIYIRKK
ncbi:DUF4097 family beta strand repeat-containing protein [Aquimarina rhabdastrellae]